MQPPQPELEVSSGQTPFWKLLLLGTGSALLGNLAGWGFALCLLTILMTDDVLEGYGVLSTFACFTLVPLGSLAYGVLAAWLGPNVSQRSPGDLRKRIALLGFIFGFAAWVVLGALTAILVKFAA